MSGHSSTPTGDSGTRVGIPFAERQTVLRIVAGNISGRGRVLGPAGGWVSLDFDDIRRHLRPVG